MATGNVAVDNETVSFWSVGTYLDIDEGPSTDANYIAASNASGDHNEDDFYTFSTINIGSNIVTQIVLWLNGYRNSAAGAPTFTLNCGGVIASGASSGFGTSRSWKSFTYSGLSKSQTDLNGMTIVVKANVLNKDAVNTIHTIYCVITYEAPPPTGYEHKVKGVLPANIGKVMGVPTANIAKVMGV